MAPSAPNAEAELWRQQVATMVAAVSKLNLPSTEEWDLSSLGEYDDGDGTDDGLHASSGTDGQDVWDFISDGELEELGLFGEDVEYAGASEETNAEVPYSPSWLATRCQAVSLRSQASSESATALPADVLQVQIMDVLQSSRPEEELQSQLTDLVGFDDLDFVIELLAHRDEIVLAGLTALAADPLPTTTDNGVVMVEGQRLLTKAQRQEQLRQKDYEHKTATLASASAAEPQYPHVYRAYNAGNTLSFSGKRYALPPGTTTHEFDKYTEYSLPAGRKGTLGPGQRLLPISELDGLCRGTFKGYRTLNRMQSLVYPVAYQTSENMLICAPTGAGKTDAAMLTILHTIGQYCLPNPSEDATVSDFAVDTEDFKIVYVAPMKALAAEITEKLGKRLAWLGVQCREYTGDMHLTKAEVVRTQIIVTTPEKWDVVTRRGTGDTELVQKVRLLIIDEVHMLHDERGAVLESLVARTERQVESTQSLIRVVGLSATLPNYVDVADFLKVNRFAGLFYFDASFRPVPLEQHFIGVKGKAGSRESKENLDAVAFEKVREMLEAGHQVMVFVHSRRDTMATARMLFEKATEEGCAELLDPSGHPRYEAAVASIRQSKAREIRELLGKGLGIHHAGMARADRNLMERLFGEGVLQVLCCTATLAWGVNLPAAAVVIKGTQVYNAAEGKFVDLGILDVLQIFGRAGRPQFEDTGIGMICTTHNKLNHYLTAVTEQLPIESRFSAKLVDNLNAEIALGTVTSIPEAVQWIGYSYLFVRMRRNPMAYGIDWAELSQDPMLVQRRRQLAEQAARTLQQSQMIIFNETTEELRSKDVGRIASQYYILHTSIQLFNAMMRPHATEADVLEMVSRCSEFDNVQSRDSESKELYRLRETGTACDVAAGLDTPQAKTNILLQAYVSRVQPEDFALGNDQNYVAQQAGRIMRALFLMALNRRWGHQCHVILSLCKAVEQRVWPYAHPLRQFEQQQRIPKAVLAVLDSKPLTTTSIGALRDMEAGELGSLVHNQAAGSKLARVLRSFPTLAVEATIAPLNRDVLRVRLVLQADFRWDEQMHGSSEAYYVWVEHSETAQMYHHEYFILSRRRLHEAHELSFTIPLAEPLPSQIYVRAVSDRWLGAETVTPVSFQHLIRPDTESVYTELLALQPLPISALANPVLEAIYAERFRFFNPMQTQIFHTLYHSSANVLLGSPTGSGKTVAAELAMWWAFRERPGSKVVYIAPMKALVRERIKDWGRRLAGPAGLRLVELTGDNTPDTRTIGEADVIVTTPEKWDGISRSWQTRGYVRKVSLVIIDEIHLLAGDRGPILEIIVSRMNYIGAATGSSVRLLGMSTACANATDLASWLGVQQSRGALFNFRHSVRPVPLELYIDGFPDVRGFSPLMQSMNRPTFLAIKNHSPDKPVIVFVPSRRQTRLTAKDLVSLCGMEDNPRRFLRVDSEDELQTQLARVQDEALREALAFGIGLHHAGLVESDRALSEELFLAGKIQVLVATSTLAWGVNLPAHLVVVKGTQFFDAKTEAYKDMDLTDVLQMLGRAGRPQFDTTGVARILTQASKKDFYKHFLHTGFPVESSLHTVLDNHLCAEVAAETIVSKQDALDYLTWTFFFRRLHKNPSYYGLEVGGDDVEDEDAVRETTATDSLSAQRRANTFMVEMVDRAMHDLETSQCVRLYPNGDVDPTALGRIMSYYYLSHRTIRYLARHAKPKAGLADVLAWMCHAAEYDELPVRHNEDLINAQLTAPAFGLPFAATAFGLPLWDPHVKAFLLLQAHMARLELPIADYVGDQTSVLDQAVRIVQAAIDVLAELNLLSSCLAMVALLQGIKSAVWPTGEVVEILPGVEMRGNVDRDRDRDRDRHTTLLQIAQMNEPQRKQLARSLGVPASQQVRFLRAATLLPNLQVAIGPVTTTSVTVQLRRANALTSREGRMFAPRFPKPQTEGYFVFVGNLASDEVASADGNPSEKLPFAKAVVKLPPAAAKAGRVDVLVVSDGYVGLEHRILGVEIPPAPTVDGVEKGKKGEENQEDQNGQVHPSNAKSAMASALAPADEDVTRKVVYKDTDTFFEVINDVDRDCDWQVFTGVTQNAFEEINREREARGRKIRFRYFPDDDLLHVTIPTGLHERGHLNLYNAITTQMGQMSQQTHESWNCSGATTYAGRVGASSGEGDSGGYPDSRLADSQWPTIVVASGVSQSFGDLERTMRWWFSASNHRVKIVLLVKLHRDNRTMEITKYTEGPAGPRFGATNTRSSTNNAALAPFPRQAIRITQQRGNDNSITYHITSGALMLEFALRFLRQPNPDYHERDILISVRALRNSDDQRDNTTGLALAACYTLLRFTTDGTGNDHTTGGAWLQPAPEGALQIFSYFVEDWNRAYVAMRSYMDRRAGHHVLFPAVTPKLARERIDCIKPRNFGAVFAIVLLTLPKG
ncbi:dead deah box DNA helicase [Grosmannia clavigera kw1407]|uniref:Dead deah box DNA helicase n=1 Tax=Grosmannia clavigera (strain kw1407 / UAMH 11150) TaxID=655863 RepID=F0XHV6_GROCL|nr:dead deah box DNA helicase [Grosmannia clavigera kw1407]EFX02787.1 dead deah box DNA helicase [Grosmannia clavigera kw1407]